MITADKLCKNFGAVEAVKDVSFEVEKGEIVGFLGSNAAGKTTTMRILTCYFPPTSGTAKVAGYDIFQQSLDVRKNVGYLPENVPLYQDMTVEYFLDFVASLKGVRGSDRKRKVDSAVSRCSLENVRSTNIGQLSKGYRQRVGIAQAIITDPPVLILDEPTVGLDPKQIIEIRNLIRSFGGKSTVILSTHILHEIEKVCDRILIIDNGRILAFDRLENLAEKLSKEETLNLTVEGDTEKVKSILRSVDGVAGIEDLGKIEKEIYRYRLKCPRDYEFRKKITSALSDAGFNLMEIFAERMSAEDVFRKMVPDKTKLATPISGNEGEKKKETDDSNAGEVEE